MSKEVLTKEINAGFLVIVLLAGTFAAISPSFMVGAQAEPYYGMDNNYNNYEQEYGMDSYDDKQSYGKDSNSNDKSKDSSNVIEKKIKCNNINVNVNGFNGVEVGTLPTALNGLATDEAQATDEGEIGASSFGSGGSGNDGRPSSGQGSDKWCLNNNEFAVVVGEEPVPPEPPVEEECAEAGDIESCFEQFGFEDQYEELSDELNSPEGLTVEINGVDVTLRSFADICSAFEGLTYEQLQSAVVAIFTELAPPGTFPVIRVSLLLCIAQALDIPIPPS